MFARITPLVLLALCLGCASPGSSAGSPPAPDVITREQIAQTHYQTALEVVEGLHSNWLHVRGPDTILSGPTVVLVYLDGERYGDTSRLRDIPAATVQAIHFLAGTAAAARYGLDTGAGVIEVTTRSR